MTEEQMRKLLPLVDEEELDFLHDNPNTDDIVEWVKWYAVQAIQACAARMVPLHAEQIRVAAVAAIREVTGCPDIKGKDGAYLVDALIVNLLEPAAQEPKK